MSNHDEAKLPRPLNGLCDNCEKITVVEFKEKKHPNNIQETYFKCEYCFFHYTSFVTDAKVRKMQRKRETLKGDHNLQKRIELFEEIGRQMTRLKYNLINFGRADL